MTHADSPWSVCLVAPNGEFIMAVRHQVQNLQRRGNIFYWRARLPAQLGCNIGSRHLAFSLKQSDHRQQATWPASLILCFMKLQRTREVY
ncbi:DUF6538 domain-containing protein [Brucella sp. H1_1004]|uniref:DUF6538 domain-containing protein n=1 Tax=Brucella sp. H1_1004 TaxID=3110109 RepID=UPI0039B4A90E